MKILITGSGGMLGSYLTEIIKKDFNEVYLPKRDELDLQYPERLNAILDKLNPNVICHLAAETDVDLCEVEPGIAAIRNWICTQEIALWCKAHDAYLVYISTSGVFNNNSGKLIVNELATPNPLNQYAMSKYKGEVSVNIAMGGNALIIRSGWMLGGGKERDKKFVGKIINLIENRTKQIKAVSDKYGTITIAKKLAQFIVYSIKTKRRGLIHFSEKGLITRYDIALEIARNLSYDGEVVPVASTCFPLSAPRSISEGIETIFVNEKDGVGFWKDGLKEYIKEFKK